MVSLVLKLMIANLDLLPDLLAVLLSQKCNLNQPVWNCLIIAMRLCVKWFLSISKKEEACACMTNITRFLVPKRCPA